MQVGRNRQRRNLGKPGQVRALGHRTLGLMQVRLSSGKSWHMGQDEQSLNLGTLTTNKAVWASLGKWAEIGNP